MEVQRFWKWTNKHMSFPTKTCPLHHLYPFQGALIIRLGWSLRHFLFAWATGLNRGGSVRGGSVLMFAKIHCIFDQPPWLPVLRAQVLALHAILWVFTVVPLHQTYWDNPGKRTRSFIYWGAQSRQQWCLSTASQSWRLINHVRGHLCMVPPLLHA